MPEIPNAVAVNEAVEITKNYESPEVVSFVNGVLGTFVRTEFPETPAKPEKADEAEG
jgi:N utilization substance protein B